MTPFEIPHLARAECDSLRELRSVFLDEPVQGSRDYWNKEATLALYDRTFGRRIAWKWEAVCDELVRRGWNLPAQTTAVLDWGCGSGVASEILVSHPGLDARRVEKWWAHDRSALAMQHTSKKIARLINSEVRAGVPADLSGCLVLLSHVLTELPEDTLESLTALLSRSAAFLWVEPGSHLCSHRLATVRERLAPHFRTVAPCTHQGPCPLRDPVQERHWCHTFAKPPDSIFHTGEWSRFAKEFGIDLRSLPVSFLVMERSGGECASPPEPAQARILGRLRRYKGRARVMACGARGFFERDLPFKTDKDLVEAIESAEFETFIREDEP